MDIPCDEFFKLVSFAFHFPLQDGPRCVKHLIKTAPFAYPYTASCPMLAPSELPHCSTCHTAQDKSFTGSSKNDTTQEISQPIQTHAVNPQQQHWPYSHNEAQEITRLLLQTTQELDRVVNSLSGGYVLPGPGGDLLRDGSSVLPTGHNIHALDPYRMPSTGAWLKCQRGTEEISTATSCCE